MYPTFGKPPDVRASSFLNVQRVSERLEVQKISFTQPRIPRKLLEIALVNKVATVNASDMSSMALRTFLSSKSEASDSLVDCDQTSSGNTSLSV